MVNLNTIFDSHYIIFLLFNAVQSYFKKSIESLKSLYLYGDGVICGRIFNLKNFLYVYRRTKLIIRTEDPTKKDLVFLDTNYKHYVESEIIPNLGLI